MKQIISYLLLFCSSTAIACDVCGASGSSQALGLLPLYYSHFVGLQYQYRSFNSTHPPGIGDKNTGKVSREYYQTLQLWGKANVGKHLQLFAFIPYQINIQKEATTTTRYGGPGDVSVITGTTIIKNKNAEGAMQHTLFGGAGIKAPTGKRDASDAATGDGYLNIQPGTGSWDFLLNTNYTVSYKKAGINTEVAYSITTPNSTDYKYGNRLSGALQAFYRLQTGKIALVPQAGVRIEHVLHDYDNYTRKWLNEQTGGTMGYAFAGVQLYYRSIGLQLSYHQPVYQHYAQGYVQAKQRADLGFLLLFK